MKKAIYLMVIEPAEIMQLNQINVEDIDKGYIKVTIPLVPNAYQKNNMYEGALLNIAEIAVDALLTANVDM